MENMHLCCRFLNRTCCALLLKLRLLVGVFFYTPSVHGPCFPTLAMDLVTRPLAGDSHCDVETLRLGGCHPLLERRTSLESSNMSDNNHAMRSKTTLNIWGILAMPWNTSSTSLSGKLAMDLNISCAEVYHGNGGILAIYLAMQVQFIRGTGFRMAGTTAHIRICWDQCVVLKFSRPRSPSLQISPNSFERLV